MINRAICFAVKAHEGTVRKGTNIPYIIHPLEAMAIVATITPDRELMVAAVLHDVLEDTKVTIEDLRREFGDRVAYLVDAETIRDVDGVSHIDSWQLRKQTAINHLAMASRGVQIVALGDKLSNMRALANGYRQFGERLWERFNVKERSLHAWYYRGLVKSLASLNDTMAYQEFAGLVEQVFAY